MVGRGGGRFDGQMMGRGPGGMMQGPMMVGGGPMQQQNQQQQQVGRMQMGAQQRGPMQAGPGGPMLISVMGPNGPVPMMMAPQAGGLMPLMGEWMGFWGKGRGALAIAAGKACGVQRQPLTLLTHPATKQQACQAEHQGSAWAWGSFPSSSNKHRSNSRHLPCSSNSSRALRSRRHRRAACAAAVALPGWVAAVARPQGPHPPLGRAALQQVWSDWGPT